MRTSRQDSFQLALWLAAAIALAWAPFTFGAGTLLSSASDVPSIFANGAAPSRDPATPVYKSLDGGAPGWYSEPSIALEHRLVFDQHVVPMWDPYDGYGTPFAATMQSQPFNPLTFLASIAPGPYTYNLYVLMRFFVLAFGCALFVRMFASFPAALVSGLCGAFSGYFLVYYNMPHLSVEVLLPWSLLAVELTIRRPDSRSAAVVAVTWLLTLLGGMPESTALAGVTILSYAAFRIFLARDGDTIRRVASVGGGLAVGTIAGSVMLVPFLELLNAGFDLHQERNIGSVVGVAIDPPLPWAILTGVAPLANGPVWNSVVAGYSGHSGMRGAPGIFGLFFATVAFVTALQHYGSRRTADRVALFLVVTAALLQAKRFGVPLVQWIGTLPVLRLVNFPKYEEAIVAVCIGCAAGLGIEAVLQRRVHRYVLLGLAFCWFTAITVLYESTMTVATLPHDGFIYGATAFSLAVLGSVLLCVLAPSLSVSSRWKLLAGLAFVEGTCAYLVPMFYLVDRPPSMARNPFAGAPYVRYLQHALKAEHNRVVAVGGALFPNWPGALGLTDPRDLNAMYPARYLRFVDAFVQNTPVTFDDWFDRFTGTRGIDFNAPSVQRWMQLSSVNYVVSTGPLPPSANRSSFLTDLWAQVGPTVPARLAPAVRIAFATVRGISENTLFEHPPFSDVVYKARVPRAQPWVGADVTLDPAVWNAACGGPVIFTLAANDASGRTIATISKSIDPKHVLAQRAWNHVALDLRRAAGRTVALRFSTSVTAPADTCAAWAEWGEPRWSADVGGPIASNTPSTSLNLVFANEAHVYRYRDVLGRLRLVHRVNAVPSGDAALHSLKDPATDIQRTAVVEGGTPAVGGSGKRDTVNIVSRRADRIELDVNADGDALLVQNDSWYPGWRAWVDGRETELRRVNYLFRGIRVPTGRHVIVIAYDSPAVNMGFAATLIGVFAILLMAVPSALRFAVRSRRALGTVET